MTLKIDDLELVSVSGGTLWNDGGVMFGVVPKVLWQRKCTADESNRVLLETNCLLVRCPDHLILIDTGYGSKLDEKTRRNSGAEAGNPILRNLASIGVTPEQIDIVILTHLHFDHCGGCTSLDASGGLRPVFPRARHFVQRIEWDDATAGLPELVGAYFPRDFAPLEESGLMEFLDEEAEVIPGVTCRRVCGHTRGQQLIEIGKGQQRAVYLGDLCPFAAHMRTVWSMAYDQFPLDQRRAKPRILGKAADENAIVLFDHDPQIKAARIVRDPRQEFAVAETLDI